MEPNREHSHDTHDSEHTHDHNHEVHDHGKGIIGKLMHFLSLGHSHEHHHEYDLAKNSKEGIKALKISLITLLH